MKSSIYFQIALLLTSSAAFADNNIGHSLGILPVRKSEQPKINPLIADDMGAAFTKLADYWEKEAAKRPISEKERKQFRQALENMSTLEAIRDNDFIDTHQRNLVAPFEDYSTKMSQVLEYDGYASVPTILAYYANGLQLAHSAVKKSKSGQLNLPEMFSIYLTAEKRISVGSGLVRKLKKNPNALGELQNSANEIAASIKWTNETEKNAFLKVESYADLINLSFLSRLKELQAEGKVGAPQEVNDQEDIHLFDGTPGSTATFSNGLKNKPSRGKLIELIPADKK